MKNFRITGFGVVICITLILFFLGLMGRFLIFSYFLKESVREDIGFNIFLNENVQPQQVEILMKKIQQRDETKSIEYVDKEKALQEFMDQGNDNPMEILDYNPLPASIHVYLMDSFVDKEKLTSFSTYLKQQNGVSDVKYAENFVTQINDNIKRISFVVSFILLLLLLVSFVLIDNTIRLSMMNNRFIIKTMQYAGASNFFIAKPYLYKSLLHGFLSGILSVTMVFLVSHYISVILPEWDAYTNLDYEIGMFIMMFLVGMGLAFLSTLNSVYKYLRTSTYKLY